MCIRDRHKTVKPLSQSFTYSLPVNASKQQIPRIYDSVDSGAKHSPDIFPVDCVYQAVKAVSYTHLDVYKRQHMYRLLLF